MASYVPGFLIGAGAKYLHDWGEDLGAITGASNMRPLMLVSGVSW